MEDAGSEVLSTSSGIVGRMDMADSGCSRMPEGMKEGKEMAAGTRIPPSHVVPFPQRRSPAQPPRECLARLGPLSDVKKTIVLSLIPREASAARITPTEVSSSASESPNEPLADWLK